MFTRNDTKELFVKDIKIGGGAPVVIQSMTNTKTSDVTKTLEQINELAMAGCELIRVAVPDIEAAKAISSITKASPIPVIADIHFDSNLAIESIKNGIDGIRINPGNIDKLDKVKEIAKIAKEYNIPIRVGGNSGSIPKLILEEEKEKNSNHKEAISNALVRATVEQCAILESFGFDNIKVSLKASDVQTSYLAYKKFAELKNYPLHLGITEAGTIEKGTIKSATGLGALLLLGLGDTIRVSLTSNPIDEIRVAKQILESVGLRTAYPEIISCPTCGRVGIDLIKIAKDIENFITEQKNNGTTFSIKKLAIMGCIVNGPGEAKECELGLAGGNGKISLFKYGKPIATYREEEGINALKNELMKFTT